MTQIEITKPDHSEATGAFLARGTHANFINGEWLAAGSGETFATLDPATGENLGHLPRSGAADIHAAVAAARQAFDDGRWSGITPMERSKTLWKIADLIEENIDELAELETLDQGKALYVGRWAEIPGAVNQFRYFAGLATKIEGATIPTSINYQPEGKEV
ncbi:MAG: aldehyde dehydrogenase family protein, partial [Pseudomonadota bacterium]